MKSTTATILSVSILIGCILALVGFASVDYEGQRVNSIEITISDDANSPFLSDLRVREHLDTFGAIIGKLEKNVSFSELHKHLMLIPSVRKTHIYPTLNGTIHIELSQRKPQARIHTGESRDFYIDELGETMELDHQYTARVPIIHAESLESAKNAIDFIEKTKSDEFWDALIDQIVVNSKGELELIPRIGARIFLGSDQDPEHQRRNLLTFYRAQIKTGNLKNYSRIDLSYKDQVIAKRYTY
ncbi:MAG TPA: hypothetical protein EYN28_03445 [Flavobacteriales bacterium]|jgi:cell division protein FtsQ|nr:hypothetical protein [Flavobacteriales bacterium]HIB77773.1 hypothetical protein [Flavobacteriales bacterium]HIN41873.1 hypothetical protein [Flavobacteriales bacterium]HIO15508.1 hypothetical protein [Flavobacteriales bacterium]HIO59209.1 hypothetical protein [Flavobacteriales bacterium]